MYHFFDPIDLIMHVPPLVICGNVLLFEHLSMNSPDRPLSCVATHRGYMSVVREAAEGR